MVALAQAATNPLSRHYMAGDGEEVFFDVEKILSHEDSGPTATRYLAEQMSRIKECVRWVQKTYGAGTHTFVFETDDVRTDEDPAFIVIAGGHYLLLGTFRVSVRAEVTITKDDYGNEGSASMLATLQIGDYYDFDLDSGKHGGLASDAQMARMALIGMATPFFTWGASNYRRHSWSLDDTSPVPESDVERPKGTWNPRPGHLDEL